MYSSELGRFLQIDPLNYYDSMNLYIYVQNSPLNFIDPFGLARLRARPIGQGYVQYASNQFYGTNDRRGSHWQFFYNDNTNSGYLGDQSSSNKAPRFGADDSKFLPKYYKQPLVKNLDDNLLRKAERSVQDRWNEEAKRGERQYSWPSNDCQTYADAVLDEYMKIKKEMGEGKCPK